MEPHPRPDPPEFRFPTLPIITVEAPAPPRLTQREKYGGLFYLGLVGLIVVVALVAWFAHGVWSMRGVWNSIYVLHDEHRPPAERALAADALSRDPRVNERQRWDMCLRKPLPDLARYRLAESLSAEAARADPRGYALTVARSPGWPPWLRVLLVRPMAYAAVRGTTFPSAPLEELRRDPDPVIGLWATFVLAEADRQAPEPRGDLERACAGDGPNRALACLLSEANRAARPIDRIEALDRATVWLRANHAPSARVWEGWTVDGSRLVPKPAP